MPDRHGGDLGIEAFTHDGVAFQCYAAQEPLTVQALWEHQRDKLTTDLGKLEKNKVEFSRALGATMIGTYVFLVHRNDSRKIVAHASTKAQEVRGWGLSFIDPEFCITVETDAAYEKERNDLFAIPPQLIDIAAVPDSDKESWLASNPALLGDARRKLSVLNSSESLIEKQLGTLLDQYLRSENGLASLRDRFPENWNRVSVVRSSKESLLALEYSHHEGSGISSVREIATDLAVEISQAVPTVSADVARTFAWGAVADWIFRCPLDFEESA